MRKCDWGGGRKRARQCAWRRASSNLVNVVQFSSLFLPAITAGCVCTK